MYGMFGYAITRYSTGRSAATRPQVLMGAVSASLNWFLQPIGENMTKPQKEFLCGGPVGLLRAGRPVVCRMARKLPDRGTQFLSRLDRLEGHLNQADELDQKVKAARTCPSV